MRTSYTRVFQKNPEALAQMLYLRLSGWGERPLANQYHVDRTTIRHWCVKFNIQPVMPDVRVVREIRVGTQTYMPIAPVAVPQKTYKYQYLFEEEDNVNRGKSYKEYVAEHKRRDPKWKFRINPMMPNPDSFV